MTLSTHVLDTAAGRPAAGVPVTASLRSEAGWVELARAQTDRDGRVTELVGADLWRPGRWRLAFDTAAYAGAEAFFPAVTIEFMATDPGHLHVPLLLSPFGYSTYRGS